MNAALGLRADFFFAGFLPAFFFAAIVFSPLRHEFKTRMSPKNWVVAIVIQIRAGGASFFPARRQLAEATDKSGIMGSTGSRGGQLPCRAW
jgi:hypothetical protein